MKAVIVHIGEVSNVVSDKLVGVSAVSKLEIAPTWDGRLDEIAGILNTAYLMMGQKFIDEHPADCRECPAYRFHNAQVLRTRLLLKEITGLEHP